MARPILVFVVAAVVAVAGVLSVAGYPAQSAMDTVNVATATVNGKSEKILTNDTGMALYYFSRDTSTTSNCTGQCAAAWPPLVSTGTPTGPSSLSGKLTTVHTANRDQVSYNGHLLYLFSRDTSPGQVKGNGIHAFGGTWHVATPSMSGGY
jgi:predicted lipoprotein with Yx(FWY)xxD motif